MCTIVPTCWCVIPAVIFLATKIFLAVVLEGSLFPVVCGCEVSCSIAANWCYFFVVPCCRSWFGFGIVGVIWVISCSMWVCCRLSHRIVVTNTLNYTSRHEEKTKTICNYVYFGLLFCVELKTNSYGLEVLFSSVCWHYVGGISWCIVGIILSENENSCKCVFCVVTV